ncbi:MAG: TonB-dependent receptor [Desulfobacterales bacterium]|nr:TonB-dependent receptor [Desulfobacterales bacterium]
MKNFRMIFIAVLLSVFCLSSNVFAEKNAETEELDISLGELLNLEKVLVTATKHRMSVRKAPAIATVVTSDEIRNMGARNIMDVLRKVPGLGISCNAGIVGESVLEVRGIKTAFFEKVLLLVDGHRTNNLYTGSWKYVFSNLMVENVERIEVVRGPGSALHGANAFIAVINVITKSAEDIGGQVVSTSRGSFDTQHYNILLSHKDSKFQISGHADYYDTDGPASLIEEDALTSEGTGLAPGNTLEWAEKFDGGIKIEFGDFSFNSRIIDRKEGPFIGLMEALNDETVYEFREIMGDLIYKKKLTEKSDISISLYADIYDQDTFIELYPEGFTGGDDKGMNGGPALKNRTLGGEIMVNYDMGNHYLTGGFAYEDIKQYDLRNVSNVPNPFVEPERTSDEQLFNDEKTRIIWALYLQNMWEISDYDSLTLGIRHDNYNDFGGTANPRVGYVHEFKNGLILKLLYGSAFRSPTFNELYIRNNPVVQGNPELKPEKISTYEVGLEYPFLKYCKLRLNYFHNDIEDLIKGVPKPAPDKPAPWINTDGKTQVDGFESELIFNLGKNKYGYINCSYQYGKDESDREIPNMANWKANAGLNYPLFRYIDANASLSWIGKRKRNDGDDRDALSAMTLVDLTLIARGFWKNLEIRASVYNVFDEDYRHPSQTGLVPNDYPVNPRSVTAEIRYKF